ncbi:hypothetical protein [Methylotenera sp. L2L1]|uniref:hypothetical protein n=1 Tax=Methylotenera sp. L2L1 TaxID=1502770 RepID=UPI000564FB5B|nr:hypothetical protein [Methylotenera sp. L2L1]
MLKKTFDDEMLERIIEASLIYMCACPAQVAKELLDMRQLYTYQQNCLSNNPLNTKVHELIAETVSVNHERMEVTLDSILTLENWDRKTLQMPEGLRKLRDKLIEES